MRKTFNVEHMTTNQQKKSAEGWGNTTSIFGTMCPPKSTETGASGGGACDRIRLLTHPRTFPTDN
eukprot:1187240-Prorocentrum_minimum.AAC.2